MTDDERTTQTIIEGVLAEAQTLKEATAAVEAAYQLLGWDQTRVKDAYSQLVDALWRKYGLALEKALAFGVLSDRKVDERVKALAKERWGRMLRERLEAEVSE